MGACEGRILCKVPLQRQSVSVDSSLTPGDCVQRQSLKAVWLCSTEKTTAHAQRLARAGVAPSPSQQQPRQSHESAPAPYVKRAARDIPTGPRGKRERRVVHPAFGLDTHREQVCRASGFWIEQCQCSGSSPAACNLMRL